MYSIETHCRPRNNRFNAVTEPFLQQRGLPFAEILSGQAIERIFAQHHGLFGDDDIFSTPIVLWAFLAQVLRGGKGAACAAAVADIATYMQQTGGRVPSGDTGDYCRARSKLNPTALRQLVVDSAQQLQEQAKVSWLWHGMHAKLVDGFTFTMPDTPENQAEFPQQKSQKPGVGFPIARACAVLSLATAAIHDVNIGPYQGKETGEPALLRGILDGFKAGGAGRLRPLLLFLHDAGHAAATRGPLLCPPTPESLQRFPPGPTPGSRRSLGHLDTTAKALLDVGGIVPTASGDDDPSGGTLSGHGSRAAG